MKTSLRIALVSGIALAGVLVAWSAEPPKVTRTVLQRGDLAAGDSEAVMAIADIPVGATTGRHTHPGEEVSYVLGGTVTLTVDGKPVQKLKVGEFFLVPAGVLHAASNEGTEPARLVVTYVVDKSKPLATPVP
jgi:quercetin dioxygenase-like cupin family protein